MEIDQLIPCKKVYFLDYLGNVTFHHVYAPSMAKWLIAHVKFKKIKHYSSLTIDQNGLFIKEESIQLIDLDALENESNVKTTSSSPRAENESIAANSEPAVIPNNNSISDSQTRLIKTKADDNNLLNFDVPFNQIVEIILPTEFDKDCVSFLVNQGYNQPLSLHVFQAVDQDLIAQVRTTLTNFMSWNENPSSKGTGSLVRNVRLEDMDSIRFEVMLLGKIYVKPDAPSSINIVDEAVDQYRAREREHLANVKLERSDQKLSESQLSQNEVQNLSTSRKSHENVTNSADVKTPNDMGNGELLKPSFVATPVVASKSATLSSKSSVNLDFGKNKTRIFQVGKQAFTLIASDQSTRNIEVMFKHVTNFVKGLRHSEHFGIQYKEPLHSPHVKTITAEDVKTRCFILKCSDESVCTEILQALKQASNTSMHGPDPLLQYHTLCRRVNVVVSSTEKERFEKAMNTAAHFVSNTFSETEQKKLRVSAEEICKNTPPRSRYEHFVIIMEIVRQTMEERQNAHDLKAKQMPTSSGPSGVSKQLNLLKSRAKKGLVTLESFWEKSLMKHDSGRESDTSPNSSGRPTSRNSSSATPPPQAFQRRKSTSSSAPNTPIPVPVSKPSSSTHVESQLSNEVENMKGNDDSEPMRARALTVDPLMRTGVGPIGRRSLDPAGENRTYGLFMSPASANSTGFGRGRSYSSPYLLRLLHLLPDVQESPAEEENAPKLKPARFSFSRLFHVGDNSARNTPTTTTPDPCKAIEMTSFKATPVEVPEGCGNRTRSRGMHPIIPSHIYEEESVHSSDMSSDEDDHGIIFTAQTPKRNIVQPAPKLIPLAERANSSETEYSASPALSSTPISSARRLSAFSEVKSSLKEDLEKINNSQKPSSSRDSPENSFKKPNDYDAELEELEDNCGVTISVSPLHRISIDESLVSDKALKRPEVRNTIHQKIFKKIGACRSNKPSLSKTGSPLNINDYKRSKSSLNSAQEIREAWRRAIKNQVLLNKIEKMVMQPDTLNAGPLAFHIKEDTNNDMIEIWKELLNSESRQYHRIDRNILRAAVMRSVPAHMRGKVWLFLYEQWKLRQHCCPTTNVHFTVPDDVSYDGLLKNLTTHQHAILIDLGRTFPNHPYFSRQLGNGQLALFNLLKAYSLMDKEVGYCQGLSFVAGILLMNMSSPNDAFELLCHLMVDMNCRKLYLPDMTALRVALYQLSRLLYDFHSDLYHHFEENEVTLMLFSTPWFLTMFASVLSLDLTARVFDMLFLEGLSALFKTALCLLGCHKEKLLQEEGFENIMGYLKTDLPNMEEEQIKRVTGEMFMLDIGQRLRIYEAEYHVLEEADLISEDQDALQNYITDMEQSYKKLVDAHKLLIKQNKDMFEQLKILHKQTIGLRQGLFDMGRVDEKRMLELDEVKKENQTLKQRRRV